MQENKEKITKEFCKGRILIFYPQTENEAAFIQRNLFKMGYRWKSSGQKVGGLSECVQRGMQLDKNIYTAVSASDTEKGFLCTSKQFDEVFDPNSINNLSGDALVREVFNRLSARQEKIEAMMEALHAEIMPKTLDKPVFKKQTP